MVIVPVTIHIIDESIAELDMVTRRFLCYKCGDKINFERAELGEIEKRELNIDDIIRYVEEERRRKGEDEGELSGI